MADSRRMTDTITEVGATLSSWKTTLVDFAVRYGLQIVGALFILGASSLAG